MKKIVSYVIVAVCLICSVMVYLNMSVDGQMAAETGVSYVLAALDQIQHRSAMSSYTTDGSAIVGGGNINVSATDWYTDMSDLKKGSCNVVETCQGFNLYDSPTFNAEGNTFFFNIRKATDDLYDMISSLGIQPKISKDYIHNQWMNLESNSVWWGGALNGNITINGAGRYCRMKDGMPMLLIAPMPTQCSNTYYSSGEWTQRSSYDGSQLVNTYFNYILVKQGEDVTDKSKWLYLPATPCDVKAHTYPWGVAQTNLRVDGPGKLSGALWVNGHGSDSQYSYTTGDLADTTFMANTIREMDTHASKVTDMLWDRCEATGISTPEWNANYDVVGCITYNGVGGK